MLHKATILLQVILLFVILNSGTAKERKGKHLRIRNGINDIENVEWNTRDHARYNHRHQQRPAPAHGSRTRRLSKRNSSRTTRREDRSKSWSGGYGIYNNAPPYLVYNKKTGSYYPYYYYPKGNGVRRQTDKVRRQK